RGLESGHLLITGGTGIIGRALLRALRHWRRGGARFRVTVLSRDPAAFLDRYPEWRNEDWLGWQSGDVRKLLIPDDVRLVIHGSGESHASSLSPLQSWDLNYQGARRVFDQAARLPGCRVLLVGSGAVYGKNPFTQPIREDCAMGPDPLQPPSEYGEGKRAVELLGTLYRQQFGLQVVSARCFAFAGPDMPLDAHFAFGNFLGSALVGDDIVIRGDGRQVRSFLAYPDLAFWLLQLLQCGRDGAAYNVGSDQEVSIVELVEQIRQQLNPSLALHVQGQAVASSASGYYVPDISKAREEMDLQVWTPLPDLIALTARYYRPDHT
ncbi:NAD-dependent epimerase/dehydratase family protein, partial [Chromobacterium sphagni]|uniref:NAD-dependent epimerase/dehydratase family protein n=1 Tax=Chromobacterium sphagni TaxID=1903179 RepID=UPI0011141360